MRSADQVNTSELLWIVKWSTKISRASFLAELCYKIDNAKNSVDGNKIPHGFNSNLVRGESSRG